MNKILFLLIMMNSLQLNAQKAIPPVAEKKPHWRVLHGESVLDNYYWMYDYFGKGPDSTRVVEYLKAENAYLDTVMHDTKKMQTDLFAEMKARIKEKDESVPWFKNGYFYYTRTEDGKQYEKFCRKKATLDAQEEILLDLDEMAKGTSYFKAEGFAISENNKLIAYGVDKVSRNQFTIFVKNIETGEIYKDAIPNTEGDPCWANDNKTFFYTSKNEKTLLSEKIKRHTLGSNASEDAIVYNEKNKANYIDVWKSKNSQYIFINSRETLSNELRMINADRPNDDFVPSNRYNTPWGFSKVLF
jgi:oligopeptidase B